MKVLTHTLSFLLAILFITSVCTNAQQDSINFTMTIKNDTYTSDSPTYYFDVYMLNTGTVPIELASLSLGFTINNDAIIEDNVEAAWAGSTELTNQSQLPITFNTNIILGTTRVINITGGTQPAAGNGSIISSIYPGTKIGTIDLLNMAPFYIPALNLKWEFVSAQTSVKAFVGGISTNITSSGTYNSSLNHYLSITSPVGSEVWQNKTLHNITWNCKDDGTIKIELTTDSGSHWILIADSIKAFLGCYTYSVPDSVNSGNCIVKLTSNKYSTVSPNPSSFSITTSETPYLTVTSPNIPLKWKYGTNQNITWSYSGSIQNIKIEFSPDGGNIWNPIVNSTPASNKSYTWLVPHYIGKFNSIRISDAANSKVNDVSDKFFAISTLLENTLIINSPNGGECWKSGTLQPIKWANIGVASINAYFSSNGGVSWTIIMPYLTASTGNYLWTLPDVASTNCLVKIEDAGDQTLFSISEKPFTLYISPNPTYKMILTNDNFNSPNEYQFDILIQRTGLKEFELSSAQIGFTYNNSVLNGGTLSASFVPGSVDSALIKSGQQNLNINTDTPGVIKIEGQSPAGGSGTGAIISDVAQGIKIGRLKLLNTVPFANMPFDLNFCFTTSPYQTIISAFTPAGGGGVYTDITDSTQHFITLTGSVGPITLISPKGGEFWKANTYQKIEWTSTGIMLLNIYFSSDGGTTWTPAQQFCPADSFMTYWVTPNITSTNCRIKIEDFSNSNTFIIGNTPFTVWQPIQSIKTPGQGQITQNFGATNVDISANVKTTAAVTVVYNYLEAPKPGTLPENVISVGKYYWNISSPSISFSNGKISTPLSKLSGIADSSKLVWLNRAKSGDPWSNIGATITSGNLISTVDFSSLYEFAIGTDTSHILSVNNALNPIPDEFSLQQNFPNPFNPSTTINYSLAKAGNVKLTVYNAIGSKVTTIVNEYKPAGNYSVQFNGSNLASGIYLYRLESGNYSTAKKFILMK
jgi:hypothetical protein